MRIILILLMLFSLHSCHYKDLQEEVAYLEQQLAEKEDRIEELEREVSNKDDRIRYLENEIDDLEDEISDLRSRLLWCD